MQAARPELLELPVLRLLLADYLGKVAAAVVQVMQALAVLAVLEVAALVVVAVAQHAVHTLLAPVVSAVMAGHWYWSSDDGQIRYC